MPQRKAVKPTSNFALMAAEPLQEQYDASDAGACMSLLNAPDQQQTMQNLSAKRVMVMQLHEEHAVCCQVIDSE